MDLFSKLIGLRVMRIQQLATLWNELGQPAASEHVDRTFAPISREQYAGRTLRIAYVLNHVRVCGGVKILLEHANRLVARGHQVTILCRQPKPTWMEIHADYLEVPAQAAAGQLMPDVDVIVCTVVDQIAECFFHKQAPVILFEQGDTYIYEFDKQEVTNQEYFRKLWSIPVPIVGVSSILVDTLAQVFGRRGQILHNALNEKVFFPRGEEEYPHRKPRILFIGQESNHFKGIVLIRQALQQVRAAGREFEVVWVAQTPQDSSFDGEMIVNPSQERLGEVYRSCDIFVSGSYYESFPLPPLEAMSSGCAVVSTDNEGIKEYGVDGENCLLGHVGDADSLAVRILDLLDHPETRSQLVEAGYQTAARFHWDVIMEQWETYLFGTIEQWHAQERQGKITLRTETLPRGLSFDEAQAAVQAVQTSMQEDFCLWLVEGETIEASAIEEIKRVLQIGVDVPIVVQVYYEHDVPEHGIVRMEQRLIKRGQTVAHDAQEPLVLPVRIASGCQSYFLRPWLATVRDLYMSQQYAELISFVQAIFTALNSREQLIVSKWLVLSLLEQDQLAPAINILRDGTEQDITYSDLLYLYARITMFLQRPDLSKQLLVSAKQIGTAWHYEEAFADVPGLCDLYLSEEAQPTV